MAASMNKITQRLFGNIRGQLLKHHKTPQVILSCGKKNRGTKLAPWIKGPVVNHPDHIRSPYNHKVKRRDGDFVHKGEVILLQTGLNYYPGENVKTDGSNRLIAMCDGEVMITTETLSPYPDSPLYGPVSQGLEIKKKFFHVRSIPLHGKFRLVNQI